MGHCLQLDYQQEHSLPSPEPRVRKLGQLLIPSNTLSVCSLFRVLAGQLRELLLRATAMPIIRNNHTDDPVCAWLTGSTCCLRTGAYWSGCLHNRVPLQGEGMGDWLPICFLVNPRPGPLHESVGSTSQPTLGPSGSAWTGCSGSLHAFGMQHRGCLCL